MEIDPGIQTRAGEYFDKMQHTFREITELARQGKAPCGATIGTAAPYPLPGVVCSCGVVHLPDPDFHCPDHPTWVSACHRCQDARIFGWAVVTIKTSKAKTQQLSAPQEVGE